MQLGLLISVLLHVAILGGALISIQSRPELRVAEPEPVAVGMITPGELTKVRQGIRTAKLLEAEASDSKGDVGKKQAVLPKIAATAPPPPPPPPPPEAKTEPVVPKAAEPPPPPPPPPAAEAQKKLEAEQKERDRVAAEQKAAEQRLAEEAQRLAEAQKKAEAEKLAEEQQRRAEEQKKAEEKKLAEEHKRAEEEKQRQEEQRRQAELKKKQELAKKQREAALKKKREEEKKRQEAEKKRLEAEAAKKKTKSFAELMAEEKALLNKDPRAKSALAPSTPSEQPTKAKGPTLGDREGRDKQISASELAMIVQTIRTCVTANWTVLSGGASAQDTSVKVRLRFNQDGSLSERPRIVNMQQSPYFVAISESAIRAVEQCAPYDLPPEKYEVWKDMVMNFSPKDMY